MRDLAAVEIEKTWLRGIIKKGQTEIDALSDQIKSGRHDLHQRLKDQEAIVSQAKQVLRDRYGESVA